MKTALIYRRVSTEEQSDNFSLGTQLTACQRWCEQNGYRVGQVFTDAGKSAKSTNRPAFLAMLKHARKHKATIDAVLVYAVSRFSRNTLDHQVVRHRLTKWNIALRSATEPIDDTSSGFMVEGMMSTFSQWDNILRSERTVTGMKASVQAGRWAWRAPIGYLNSDTPSLKPDPDRAPLVKHAFELAAQGRPLVDIVDAVTRDGLTTKRGMPISIQTLSKLVRNPLYCGRVSAPSFDVHDIEGDFEPLIPESLFARAQAALSSRAACSTRSARKSADWPLRRFAKCKCGTSLTGSSSTSGTGKAYAYYSCPRGCVRIAKLALESLFMDLLSELQPTRETVTGMQAAIRERLSKRTEDAARRRGELKRKQHTLEARQEALVEKMLEDDADADVYSRMMAKLRTQVQQVRVDLEREQDGDTVDISGALDACAYLLSDAPGLWCTSSAAEKVALQTFFFPAGVVLEQSADSQNQKLGTDVTCSAFSHLAAVSGDDSSLVCPPGSARARHPRAWPPRWLRWGCRGP